MLKKFLLFTLIGLSTQATYAQVDWSRNNQQEQSNYRNSNTTSESNDKLNRVFIGGGFDLGLGSLGGDVSSWSFGLSPVIGYSVSERFDVGGGLNINYYSYKEKYYDGSNTKNTNFNVGVLGFARFYPFNSIFLQAQPELNRISYVDKYTDRNGTVDKKSFNSTVPSFLVGIGYGSREIGNAGYYTTLMFDLMNEPYSPYRSYTGSKLPILKFGFMYYLGRK